jgi:Tfp pilus assembly protein PilF
MPAPPSEPPQPPPQPPPGPPTPQTETALLERALAYQKAGHAPLAAELCREILAANPERPEALLMLGLILGRTDDPAAGAALIARYLAHHPDDPMATCQLGLLRQRAGQHAVALALFERALALAPTLAPALQGLGVSLHALGRLDDAAAALERALALAPRDAIARNNLGDLRRDQGRLDDALAAFDQALALAPGLATAHCNRGIVLAEQHRHDDAIPAFERALALDPGLGRAHFELAEALEACFRPEEAHRHRVAAVRGHPLVTMACTGAAPAAHLLVLCSAGRGDVSVKFLLDRARFEKTLLFLLLPEDAPPDYAARIAPLPPVDLIFNAIADADRGAPYLAEAASICARLGRPVLNPPAAIAPTRRDRTAARLAGIAGLVVPATRRVDRAALAAQAAAADPLGALRVDGPVLVRPVGSHGGEGLERIDHPAALAPYLERTRFDEFYLTDFCDFRSADGHYRKYRFVFVDRVAFPYHEAISKDWRVHYWRADMDAAPWMKQEEARFLADPDSVFGGARRAAIEAIGRRLDLDYGGADCGILPDGRIVLFEANANMLVHLNDPPDAFPYKHRDVPRIFDAMAELVLRRVRAAG